MTRVLLKISWEALAWNDKFWINPESLKYSANLIKETLNEWIQIWVVLWAWNFMRWATLEESWVERCSADNIWMLAIAMNWIALKDALKNIWVESVLQSSFEIPWICNRFNKSNSISEIEKWKVIIFVWWTWNPYFTTDTVSVLRWIELECDFVIKATQVDWLYDKDPNKFDDAKFIKEATFSDVISNWYKVMDQTAFALAKENNMKIKIVSFTKPWAITSAVKWWNEWTTIKN